MGGARQRGMLKVKKYQDAPNLGGGAVFTRRGLFQPRQLYSLRPYKIFVYEPKFPQRPVEGLMGPPLTF